MEERTIAITGVTSGIGKELVKICAQSGMKLILIARNELKIKQLVQDIKESGFSKDIPYFIADLSVLEEVWKIGNEISEKYPVIDILVNNAGAFVEKPTKTQEGYELTLAINYLSPVLLSFLLLPSLKRSKDARILNISSLAHVGGSIHKPNFQIKKKNYGFPAYNQSKLLILMFTKELARKLRDIPIKVNAIHPGMVKTNLGRDRIDGMVKKHDSMMSYWVNRLGIFPKQSAKGLFKVLTDQKFQNVTGKYFSRDKITKSFSRNKKKQKDVWEITISLLIDTLGKDVEEKIKKNLEVV